jgi:hypothetical protein
MAYSVSYSVMLVTLLYSVWQQALCAPLPTDTSRQLAQIGGKLYKFAPAEVHAKLQAVLKVHSARILDASLLLTVSHVMGKSSSLYYRLGVQLRACTARPRGQGFPPVFALLLNCVDAGGVVTATMTPFATVGPITGASGKRCAGRSLPL